MKNFVVVCRKRNENASRLSVGRILPCDATQSAERGIDKASRLSVRPSLRNVEVS